MSSPLSLMEETRVVRRARGNGRAFLPVKPIGHRFKLLLIVNHLSKGSFAALFTSDSLGFVIEIVWLELSHRAILAVSMYIF